MQYITNIWQFHNDLVLPKKTRKSCCIVFVFSSMSILRIVPLTNANLHLTLFSDSILSCSSKQIFLPVNLFAPPILCPLWPFTNTTLFPKGSVLVWASIPRCSLFITAWCWRTLFLIAWQMPLSWAYVFTITLAICTAGYVLKRDRLSTTLEGTKRWRPTWSLGQDSTQHHAITKNTVGLSSIYLMPLCLPLYPPCTLSSIYTLVSFNLL